MKAKIFFLILLMINLGFISSAQNKLSINVTFDKSLKSEIDNSGRLYVFLCPNNYGQPYTQQFPNPGGRNHIFAKNYSDVELSKGIQIDYDASWIGTPKWGLDDVKGGKYYLQVLWDHDTSESRIEAPGNVYSEKQMVEIKNSMTVDCNISTVIEDRKILEHTLANEVKMKSPVLSKFWNKDVFLKASILLPHKYDVTKTYTIRYNVAGYGGRYTRINRMLGNPEFMSWWDSNEAPQIITVYLDGEGPFGDSYQMDSDNSGPYGQALIEEFIPYIEKKFRGTNSMEGRFVDGCSTGGWVSLGLQLYYPDMFQGVFSYSPDAVEFENYQLINIYRDKNAYVNEFGIPRMVMRNTDGEPMLTMKDFIQYENVLGSSNTYLNSGGQFSAHTALYSPKGEGDLPQPMFDPVTGDIDAEVSAYWEKYDFKKYAKENWETLGPKLQGKVHIWMGDMDNFYLNQATRELSKFLNSTSNPKSDADVQFLATEGHCSMYSDKIVLKEIQKRINRMNGRE